MTISAERRRLRCEVFTAYSHACACCGVTHEEFLTVDHEYGGGQEHARRRRRAAGVSNDIYRWLRSQGYPREGYRLLCLNCHSALNLYGRCPHADAEKGGAHPHG